MKEEIENRLKALTAEFKAGQEMLAELDTRRSNIQMTLTRISGAIQVLQELLQQENSENQGTETASKTPMAAGTAAKGARRMESNRLEIRRLRAQYLLPAEHPYPETIKDRLDGIIRHDLVPSIATALAPWFSDADSSIWLIRELRFESTVNIAWKTDQLARAMTSRLARAFDTNLQGGSDDGNVRYFPNRAAYLSSFLTDLAAGSAWSQWYYESFHGLKMLPISAALRTAICDDPKTGKESLSQLANDELKKIVRALTPQDASGVVETFADHLERGDDASCCQKVWNEWEKNV